MNLFEFCGALQSGLIFSLVALGVLITFRILNFTDLTVNGSFPLGGAVAAFLITSGNDPFLATGIAAGTGAVAGLMTGWLHVRLKITDLLAGILMMTALYSVTLRMTGDSGILLSGETIFTVLLPDGSIIPECQAKLLLLLLIVVMVKFTLDWFFSTKAGLAVRATGVNARMARAQGVNTERIIVLVMALSNALVALAGALFVQSMGNLDASMGIGIIVVGLAAVMIGETILPVRRLIWVTLSVVLGAVLFYLVISLAWVNKFIGHQDLYLVTAVLVVFILVLPMIKRKLSNRKDGAG